MPYAIFHMKYGAAFYLFTKTPIAPYLSCYHTENGKITATCFSDARQYRMRAQLPRAIAL